MILFDPPHGGYPGEIVIQDEYLLCIECRYSWPLDALAEDEYCYRCGGSIIVARAHPCEATLKLL